MIEASYVAHSGGDLLVVNAARVSFAKRSADLSTSDRNLIRYLAREGHWAPFSHPQITLHCRAPIFVRTQAFKHKVGFAESEVSRRYVADAPEFFQPDHWRAAAPNKKQGSSDVPVIGIEIEPGEIASPRLLAEDCYRTCAETYEALIKGGVAPELARMILPQATMTEWFWTGSLAAWARFVGLRTNPHAQAETADLALACGAIIAPLFPVSWEALTGIPESLAGAA